ncbi:NlpC/P60 family protein [Selenomonas ruminantium]|uniref:NlpC/P60 family protein n=1 Tax=Selenomonas ruminantium TaxID=971 RepID=A0A1M6RYA8_SELRU|nr:NlpC/P60 family protein [Selenomonas ruminantium]SHK37522.1 NlpC/P60 family protein [Selenomonas ruminantium]
MRKISRWIVASMVAGSMIWGGLSAAQAAPQKDNPMEKAVVWALQIAADDSHGYSQGAENATANNPYTGSREGPDYDCSALVYHALEHAGFPIIEAWHQNPDYMKLYQGKQYSGDADTIWPDMQRIGGFTKYSWNEVKDNLKRGDILCRPEAHVAIYIGNGKTVEARGVNNPRGGDWRTGDQGGEIDCYSAYGRGWTEVYRYTGK